MLVLSKKVSNSDFPLLCILLLPALCHPYNQLNPPFLGAVSQLFSDILSSWELGSLPTSCTCDWLLDIECKCVRCSVKSLAALEAHWTLESVGQSSGKTSFVFVTVSPFSEHHQKGCGDSSFQHSLGKVFVVKKLLLLPIRFFFNWGGPVSQKDYLKSFSGFALDAGCWTHGYPVLSCYQNLPQQGW